MTSDEAFKAIAQCAATVITHMKRPLPDRIRIGVPRSLVAYWQQTNFFETLPALEMRSPAGEVVLVDIEPEEERSMVARMRDKIPQKAEPQPDTPAINVIRATIEPEPSSS